MSKKQAFKTPKSKNPKNSQKPNINFRTENANKNSLPLCSRFLSAPKKDFFAVFKNGHF